MEPSNNLVEVPAIRVVKANFGSKHIKQQAASSVLTRLPASNDPILRLNGLCPYYTMFPVQFPFRILKDADRNDWVLDPFCGRGTTLYAARLRGLPSVGIDSNPVAAAIAASKVINVRPDNIISLADEILSEKSIPDDVPRGRFWRSCYNGKTLKDICRLREYLLTKCSTKSEIGLRGIILGILHGPKRKGLPTYLSNQMPRTYATKPQPAIKYWYRHNEKPAYVDVLDAITRRVCFVYSHIPDPAPGVVYQSDSRYQDVKSQGYRFKWVISSPPYYGMRSYWPDQWLRNWFLGGPSDVEYNHSGQISHKCPEEFVTSVAEVWRRSAEACVPGARMVIRFGAIPSSFHDPGALLKQTLYEADCGWRILTIQSAGKASRGKRQSEQFNATVRDPIDEIDLYARLEV